MERNPEFYRPKEKDQAFHPQPGYPETIQWWYYDAIFDNGYCIWTAWQITQSTGMISFDVCGPDGSETHVTPFFHPSAVVASTETLDVKMGDNRIYGRFPRYEMHFRYGDTGADLVYELITQEFMEPPDGIYVGREQCPATPIYYGYVFRPRCKITGKLILAGKEIPVQGEGYADHQWTNVGVADLATYAWSWGKIFLPKHTIIWWNMQLNQVFGYQRVKFLWAFKGEKLFEYLRDADYYQESSDLEVDQESGIAYPRKIVFIIDERKIRGTATYTVKRIMHKIPLFQQFPQRAGWKLYHGYLSDCHTEFEMEGEKIVADTKEIHEIAI